MKLKINDKEYNIKFGYEATVKSGIIKKLQSFGEKMTDKNAGFDQVAELLEFLPEFLLVGLQKFHKDEFGCDFENENEKKAMLGKAYDLIDDYFDADDADMMVLFEGLQNELMNNGFLAKLLRQNPTKTK